MVAGRPLSRWLQPMAGVVVDLLLPVFLLFSLLLLLLLSIIAVVMETSPCGNRRR